MRHKFCPLCGRKIDRFFDNVCEKCFSQKNKLVKMPEEVKVNICRNCEKTENLEKIVKNEMKVYGKLKNIKIEKRTNNKINVKVSGLLSGNVKKKEEYEVKVKINKKLCENCAKIAGGYYEAIIQLRSKDNKKITNTFNFIKKIITKKNGFITKIKKLKNGLDLYISPKKIVNLLIKKIPDKNEVKKSYTLVTKKDGRDLYRTTVLIRLDKNGRK